MILQAALLAAGGLVLYTLTRGAPYLPTKRRQAETALRLLDLRPGQHLLELGCGDGTVLLRAARKNISATGYEINPLLWLVAWARTRRYRRLVTVRFGDYWRAGWPAADGVFVFLLDPYMAKLDRRMAVYAGEQGRAVPLASVAFEVPGRPAERSEDGVHLYAYGGDLAHGGR